MYSQFIHWTLNDLGTKNKKQIHDRFTMIKYFVWIVVLSFAFWFFLQEVLSNYFDVGKEMIWVILGSFIACILVFAFQYLFRSYEIRKKTT